MPIIVQAQDPSLISTFEFGQKPFIVNELDISLTYLDESPSPDYFTTNFSLEPSSTVFYFSVGAMQDNFREKHLIGLKFDMFYKGMFGFNFDFYGGYMLNIGDRFKFGPKLDVTFLGIANKKIGEIQNNTGYIQVNDTRFYDEEVDVSFQNIWFGLKPSLFTSLKFNRSFSVYANVGYSLNASLVNINFKGDANDDNENTSASENLNAENLTFDITYPQNVQDPKKEAKVGFNGLYFSFGVSVNVFHFFE